MKKRVQIGVCLMLLLVLAVLTVWAVGKEQEYHQRAVTYEKVLEQQSDIEAVCEETAVPETRVSPDPESDSKPDWESGSRAHGESDAESEPEEAYISPVDFQELWKVNPDVAGWLTIPGTRIDYPILQAENNEKYLHTDMEGKESTAGAIYMDFENERDFSDFHNVIYGHHMKNGSMFKDIVYFKEQDFLENHRDIYLYTPEREIHLKAFAALYTTPDPIRRKVSFQSQEELEEYAESMTVKTQAWIEPEEKIGKLYSFITCSYEFADARTILYAYEVSGEK